MKAPNLIILFIFSLLSCQKADQTTLILAEITGEIPAQIVYTKPVNGNPDWMFTEKIKPDTLGRFNLEFDLNGPAFVKFLTNNDKPATIIAEPGKTYNVLFDLKKDEGIFKVSGESNTLHTFYNQLPDPLYIQDVASKFLIDSTTSNIETSLLQKKKEELVSIENLYNEGNITKDVFDLLMLDRKCYYDAILSTTMWIKYIYSKRGSRFPFNKEFADLWQDIYKTGLIENPELIKSVWFSDYAQGYIYYHQYLEGTLGEQSESETPYTDYIRTAEKHLPEKVLEAYIAHYLYDKIIYKNYEKELIGIFNDFSSEYPESSYLSFMTPYIDEIVEYHKITASEFKDDIKFVDSYQQISTLSEAASRLMEGLIYVDVWATWCGPCKVEFEHKSALQEVLNEYNVQLLYLSIDRDDYAERWKNMIKFYDLEGFHIRAGEELSNDLKKIFDKNGSISIPWYILMDSNGNILKKHASKPSQSKKLAEEIRNLDMNSGTSL